jgi:pantoate--beta-alanine ligase
LEGEARPHHFAGVATVVAKLLIQAAPDLAVFGEKDYQQLAVIRYLVRDLAFPIDVIAAPTVREADGLAMSSRNQYLADDERLVASRIHAVLQGMREAVAAGGKLAAAEAHAAAVLRDAGFDVDYAAVRRRDLTEAAADDTTLVALVAAKLGRTRLIDNLEFERSGG